MRRRTFDALLATGGCCDCDHVGDRRWTASLGAQLREQQRSHSAGSAEDLLPDDWQGIAAQKNAEITKYVTPYAGQKVVNGKQAQVFADHYIKVHLSEVAGGKTYSEVSGAFLTMDPKDPNYATVAQQRQTLFMGETLRGMLLNAYGFWKIGQIAADRRDWVSFITAGVMLLLSALGFCTFVACLPRRRCCQAGSAAPAPVEL